MKFGFAVRRSSSDVLAMTTELTKNGVDVIDLTGADVIDGKTKEAIDQLYVVICRASRYKYRRLKRKNERKVYYMEGVKVLA